jgi:glutathione S-transferase
MVVAHEKGVTERIECVRSVAIANDPNPALMADNPLNKIPCLVLDDRSVLQDSRVICEYLDALDGKPVLFPQGEQRWSALRRQALGDGFLDLLIVWRHERNRPEELHHLSYIEAYRQKAVATLDRLARDIPGRADFDIGDVAIGCALAYVDFRFGDLAWRDGRGDLARWFDRVAARPSFVATPIVNDGGPR